MGPWWCVRPRGRQYDRAAGLRPGGGGRRLPVRARSTVSTTAPSRLSAAAALRLARHVDAVGAAPVSTTRLNLVVRRKVLDGLPRRRRRRRTGSEDELTPSTSALAALTALDAEQRIALVLRHHDGLLLPDIAAALGLSYPEAEAIAVTPASAGAGDRCVRRRHGRRSVRPARARRARAARPAGRPRVGGRRGRLVPVRRRGHTGVPDSREGDDPWAGRSSTPSPSTSTTCRRSGRPGGWARRSSSVPPTLAALLAVAALTAPGGDDGSTGRATEVVAIDAGRGGRGGRRPIRPRRGPAALAVSRRRPSRIS